MIAGTPHFADPSDTMRRTLVAMALAAEPDACGRTDARAADRPQ